MLHSVCVCTVYSNVLYYTVYCTIECVYVQCTLMYCITLYTVVLSVCSLCQHCNVLLPQQSSCDVRSHNTAVKYHNYTCVLVHIVFNILWNLYIVDQCNCSDCRGDLNSGVVLYRITTVGTKASVHIREVSLFQRCS